MRGVNEHEVQGKIAWSHPKKLEYEEKIHNLARNLPDVKVKATVECLSRPFSVLVKVE